MRRLMVAVILAACLAAAVVGPSSPVGADNRPKDGAGRSFVIEEGKPYSGEWGPFASRRGVPFTPDSPQQCSVVLWCDTVPLEIVEPEASKAGGQFAVRVEITWKDEVGLEMHLFDDGQIRAAAGRLPTDGDLETWNPITYDPQSTVLPYSYVTGGAADPKKPKSLAFELNSQDDGPGGRPPDVLLGHFNLVVVFREGSGAQTKYSLKGEMTITPPDELPGEVLDDELLPIPFSEEAFAALPEPVATPLEEAAGATGPLLFAPAPPPPAPRRSPVTTVTPLPAPVDDGPVTLDAVDADLDPLLLGIKQRNLEDDLAAPSLEVAAAVEKPPVKPSGTTVTVSLLALPLVGAVGFGGFWLRRRASFRLA